MSQPYLDLRAKAKARDRRLRDKVMSLEAVSDDFDRRYVLPADQAGQLFRWCVGEIGLRHYVSPYV